MNKIQCPINDVPHDITAARLEPVQNYFCELGSKLTLTCQIIVHQILLFFVKKHTYTTLLGPTHLLISEIFPSKPGFHLHK